MDHLPNEILINILGYLNTYDLLQFCTVFKHFEYFLKEKNVIRISDWSRRFEIHDMNICSFISTKMDPSHIKVLKINCIYWVSGEALRRLLQKLVNLEDLYAVDTMLGFKDIIEYSKLNKLAISVEDFNPNIIKTGKTLKSLTKLYIKIVWRKTNQREIKIIEFNLKFLFWEIRQLEELWVQDDGDPPYIICYENLVVKQKNLRKFVIRSKNVLPLYDFLFEGLSKTFECKRWNTDSELIFERVLDRKPKIAKSIFDPKETDLEKAWEVFSNLHANLPCGPKESKLINIQEELNNIRFEHLNFCHSVILCNFKYVQAALQVLKSDNSKGLKRLNFRSCLLQDFQDTEKREENTSTAYFKKVRIGVKKDPLNHPFEKVSKHLKNLVELELYHCQACTGSAVISAYSLIGNFENLEKLTLEIPYLVDGSFLEKVFRTCSQLEYLSLKLTAPNKPFLNNLWQYLEHSTALKDFRIECSSLTIETMFNSLCKIPRKKLQRIFIKCDQINYLNNARIPDVYSTFLEDNQQLIFFLLITSQSTAKQIVDIQRILHKFKEGHPAKKFFVKKEIDAACSGSFPIPPAHHDFIFNRTRVSVIDFDEF